MYLVAILSLAQFFWTTSAQLAKVSTYKTDDCSGEADVAYVDVSQDYCFAISGNSFDDLTYNEASAAACVYATTWSGSNCEGSSALFKGPIDDCVKIPYAGIELIVGETGFECQNPT
jgi:hypothetical protein